jgi:hypothetical protein
MLSLGPDTKERASRVVSLLAAVRVVAVRAEEEEAKKKEEGARKAAEARKESADDDTTDSDVDDLPKEENKSSSLPPPAAPLLPVPAVRACGDGFSVSTNESGARGGATSRSSCAAAAAASAVAPPPGPALASSALGKRHAALLAAVSRAVGEAVGGRGGRGGGARGSSLSFAPEGVPAPAEVASAVAALTTTERFPPSSASLILPPTDLAGSGDPVRLVVARAERRAPPARQAAFDLVLTNVSPSGDDLVGAVVRLELSGAAASAAAGAASSDGEEPSSGLVQPVPRLAPGASFEWRTSASLAGPGAAALRARLVLRLPPSALSVAAATGNSEEPGCLRLAGELSWGPADWIKRFGGGGSSPPSAVPSPPRSGALSTAAADFFASWAGTPSSPALCWRGSSARAGASAGPALLGALTRGGGRLVLDWLAPLPASSGFAAALRGSCAAGLWSPSSAAAVAGGAATLSAPAPPVLIFVTARLVVAAGDGGSNSSQQQPAPSRPLPRLDVRCELRTFDAAAAAAVAADAGAFFVSLAAACGSGANGGSSESELLGCSSLAHGGGAPPRPPAARASGVGAALAEAFAETVSFDDGGSGSGVGVGGGERRQQAAAIAAAQEFWRRSLVARAASV